MPVKALSTGYDFRKEDVMVFEFTGSWFQTRAFPKRYFTLLTATQPNTRLEDEIKFQALSRPMTRAEGTWR